MSKEAIIFILDANVTMDAPYPPPRGGNDYGVESPSSSSSPTTTKTATTSRLVQARDAVLDVIVDRMWKSKQNEAGLVVLRAGTTHHHLSRSEAICGDDDEDDVGGIGRFFRRCGGGGSGTNGYDAAPEDAVFPNIVELPLGRPSPRTLRTVRDVQCTMDGSMVTSWSDARRGGLCDGLILAADALYRRTRGRKYQRRIVAITDAEHEVRVDGEQLQFVLGELCKMEVELLVLGIGFEGRRSCGIRIKDEHSDDGDEKDHRGESDDYEDLEAVPSTNHEKPEAVVSMRDEDDIFGGSLVKEEEGNPDEVVDDVERGNSARVEFVKRENEKLLRSIARETGGCILAANGAHLTELLRTRLPRVSGLTNSVGKKVDFRIAPGLSLVVKSAKLTSQQNLPTTVKEAYQFDPRTGEKLRDGNGELMTLPTRTQTNHYDDGGNVVPYGESYLPLIIIFAHKHSYDLSLPRLHHRTHIFKDKRTDAFRYGSDLIPVGKMDMLGINAAFVNPGGSVEMIGYIDRKVVESSNLLMGPAYSITGGESRRSRSAVAALSQALEETDTVGYCRVVRTKNGDPKIGALFPRLVGRDDGGGGGPGGGRGGGGGRYLVFLGLPFADDLQRTIDRRVPSECRGCDREDERACDALIDAMMLPEDDFRSERMSSPALAAYRRMVAAFAMDPMDANEETMAEGLSEGRISEASRARPLRDFDVVRYVHERASMYIDAFLDAFPLVEHRPEDDKKRKFWGDGNDH
jgi:ATP-dependent DNA helicase 2 subunit 2